MLDPASHLPPAVVEFIPSRNIAWPHYRIRRAVRNVFLKIPFKNLALWYGCKFLHTFLYLARAANRRAWGFSHVCVRVRYNCRSLICVQAKWSAPLGCKQQRRCWVSFNWFCCLKKSNVTSAMGSWYTHCPLFVRMFGTAFFPTDNVPTSAGMPC